MPSRSFRRLSCTALGAALCVVALGSLAGSAALAQPSEGSGEKEEPGEKRPRVRPLHAWDDLPDWITSLAFLKDNQHFVAGTYELGKHDWYDEGAAHLLTLQKDDGTWPAGGRLTELCDTCFTLLFLERGTIPLVKLPPKRTVTGLGGAEPQQTPAKAQK